MENTETTTSHTCCGCGKSCRRTTILYGISIIILSGILAAIAPSVITKFGIPLLRIEPAVEDMSIQSYGDMNTLDTPPANPAPAEESANNSPEVPATADVSVQ